MELSEEDITEFQEIYKEEFGEEISREESYNKAIRMLRLLEVVYKPSTKEEWEELRERSRKMRTISKEKNSQN